MPTLPRPMNPRAVFKAYDIRGRTDTGELDPRLYELIGSGFVAMTGAAAIAVGRDCRESSPDLFEGLVRGITNAGADVVDLGEVPTDVVYYYSGAESLPGAMITASHNPPRYNGLKLCRSGASPVGVDTGLSELLSYVEAGETSPSAVKGLVTRVDAKAAYVRHLLSVVPADSLRRLHVAVDGGNGMAGVVVEDVFSEIPCSLDGLYLEPDGTFPNHPADPIQLENLADLLHLVESGNHDLGVAFDGDADRAFFVDDLARPLSGSTVTALVSRWALKRSPGAAVVHNLITSKAVPEIITESGGRPIRTRVGHSFIKQVMADTDAVFGGEHSGHYYFRDNFRADSGMLAMLVLLQVMSEEGRPLSEIRADVERYRSSGERNYEVENPSEAIDLIASSFSDAHHDLLDGLTVDLGDGWFNVRPSNTEPLLRLNVEAGTDGRVEQIVADVESALGTGR